MNVSKVRCPNKKCNKILRHLEGDKVKCSNCGLNFRCVCCIHCNFENYFENYICGQRVTCGGCKKKFQQLNCLHCFGTVYFKNDEYFEGGLTIFCPYKNCKKKFQQLTCSYCSKIVFFGDANYNEGSEIKCPYQTCERLFTQISCPHCMQSINYRTKYNKGLSVQCPKCDKKFQQINCHFCKKSMVWKNNNKGDEKVTCPFEECAKKFFHTNCMYCKESLVIVDDKINYVVCTRCNRRFLFKKNEGERGQEEITVKVFVSGNVKDFEENVKILRKIIEKISKLESLSEDRTEAENCFKEFREQYKILLKLYEKIQKILRDGLVEVDPSEKLGFVKKRGEIEKNFEVVNAIYENLKKKIDATQNTEKMLMENSRLRLEIQKNSKILRTKKFEFEIKEEEDEFLNEEHKIKTKRIIERLESVLKSQKKKFEGNKRKIEQNLTRVLRYLQNTIKNKPDNKDKFEKFLMARGILAERNLLVDYTDHVLVSSKRNNAEKVLKAKLRDGQGGQENRAFKMLKVISYNEGNKIRTKNEIINLSELRHPSVMKINCVFIFKQREVKKICMETDFCDRNLLYWLKGLKRKEKPETFEEKEYLKLLTTKKTVKELDKIKLVFRKILEVLLYCHAKGIEHNNLNPMCIFVQNESDVIISDFSNSKQIQQVQILPSSKGRYLPRNSIQGKSGGAPKFGKKDMYAFGKMLFENLVKMEHIDLDLRTIEKNFKYLKFEQLDLLKKLLVSDEEKRISSKEAIHHEFFSVKKTSFTKIIRPESMNGMKKFVKDVYFKMKVKKINITIDRKNVMDDFLSFVFLPAGSLQESLINMNVKFQNERGIDQGGLTRELFSCFIEQFKSSKYIDKVNEEFVLPTDKENFSSYFYLIGKLFCRCLFERRNLRINFGPFFYSMILNILPKTFDEWSLFARIYDPQFQQSQLNILNGDDFSYVEYDPQSFSFVHEGELKVLSENNKRSFVMYKFKEFLIGKRFRLLNIKGFQNGFFSIINKNYKTIMFKLINGFEFDELMFGKKTISKELLLKNVKFSGNARVNLNVRRWIVESTEKERLLFIRFCTGLSNVSSEGKFYNGKKFDPIKIRSVQGKKIFAHTCFFALDVGKSMNYDEFKENIGFAITQMSFNE